MKVAKLFRQWVQKHAAHTKKYLSRKFGQSFEELKKKRDQESSH